MFPDVAGTQPQSRTLYPGAGSALPAQFDGVQGGPQNTLVPYLPNPVVTPPQRGHLVEVPATEIAVVGSGLLAPIVESYSSWTQSPLYSREVNQPYLMVTL